MNVNELIVKLQKMPPHSKVYWPHCEDGYCAVGNIELSLEPNDMPYDPERGSQSVVLVEEL